MPRVTLPTLPVNGNVVDAVQLDAIFNDLLAGVNAVDNTQLVAGSALANIGAAGVTSTYLAKASNLTQLGWYSVQDYGADPTGVTDSTTAIQNAINALTTGGMLWFPPGTYSVSASLLGQNDTNYRYWIGAGMDLTKIVANSSFTATGVPVVNFECNGGIAGMTIDGGTYAQLGLSFSDSAAVAIDHWRCVDVKARNIKTNGNWVAVFTGPASAFNVQECRIESCIFEGPSNASFDGFDVSNVVNCFVTNLTLRNMSRSPNFYFVDKLKVSGLFVTGVASYAGVVFDNPNNHVELVNAYIDSTCAATLIASPDFKAANCTFESGVNFSLSGTAGPLTNGNVVAEFVNCRFGKDSTSAVPVTMNGSSPTVTRLSFTNCEFMGTTGAAHIFNAFTSSNVWPEISFVNCRFNSANLTGAACAIVSNAASTVTSPFTIVGCTNSGAVTPTGIYTATTPLSASMNIRGNSGFNPKKNFTPSTAIASGVLWTNTTGYDVTVVVAGGTVSQINLNGVATGLTSGAFFIAIGANFQVNWTVAPTITYGGA